ncbi:Uncharacterized protein Adt_18462 [Abeliophyllum distichum]|uniref:Uncharacterized protein n=1 Tax=Abeliophyllum distichum TaxID=126358 RepID=A0ABD1TJF5_9LAMI
MFLLSCASMADVMSHGGGGAGDPPHQSPRQLDSVCESEPPSTRGISRGLNLQKVWQANGKWPLSIAFDNVEHAMQPIENNAKYFTRLVENQVRFTISPCYPAWTEVPEKQWARLRSVIEGNRSPDEYWAVCAAVDRLVDDRYQDYPSVQGSNSFSATCYDMGDLETPQWPNIIESFWTFQIHWDGNWVNPVAVGDCVRTYSYF